MRITKRFRVKNLRSVGLLVAICLLAGAVATLITEQITVYQTTRTRQVQIDRLEQEARENAEALTAWSDATEEHTNESLARELRQRYAGIAALVTAGLIVALVKIGPRSKPVMPMQILDEYERRRGEQPPSQTVAPPASEGATQASAWLHLTMDSTVDVVPVAGIVERIGKRQRDLVPLLQAINEHYRYLPAEALRELHRVTAISASEIAEVASFYGQFRTRPRGKHLIHVCRGTACHVSGADRLLNELRRILNIPEGQDTDPQGNATIETVGCLGCCTLAPVLQVDERIEGHVRVDDVAKLVDWSRTRELTSTRRSACSVAVGWPGANASSASPELEIRVGLGSCCVAGGSRKVMETLQQEIALRRIQASIKQVGCVGICHLTPLVEVVSPNREPIVATRATPADVRRILRNIPGNAPWPYRVKNRVADFYAELRSAQTSVSESPCHISAVSDERMRRFIDPQVRIVTEHSGEMDPTSLEEYREHDGFVALQKCLKGISEGHVIDAVEQSGLRGRGGGGFPTGVKWRKMSEARGEKIVVCNGDEGDPGAFMDRMVMESYPYRVLEGMAIAAYAVGARRAILYIRHEYPLAVERIQHAIRRMTEEGYLGPSILGTTIGLDVEVVEGAGAFVCGEETALLQSIMGHRGTPQLRPPYPVERGLWEQPTLVNNVETFANVPWIIRHGADRFAALGTESSRGTKVFSLAGKIRRGGLIEIPMGLTIREIVERIGGGVGDGKTFKAVQIGGPSGACVPASLADTPIDYESLRQIGAIMGSGGLVVMDNDDCMVDVARYFLEFTQRESCGHCTYCRVGTRKLLEILERMTEGKGKRSDLEEIEALAQHVMTGSMCALGKTAPNPVLSTLKYFREEYEAHLTGKCPAGRCKALIRYETTSDCTGCTLCAQHCPVGAIAPTPYKQHVIDADLCTRCDVCRTNCPEHAIQVI
jgi:NADH:ubiquinone oxidoreductase subunit F (NADH-binding)/NADH:ubiquinone oxidoreductase subunit E/NAD-dependent dihydropyrimidine dehydrogenase PreA subunit